MQTDILDLNKLNKEFDIIESGSVLHHMDNPFAGWKVLTNCLKPGGLMKIVCIVNWPEVILSKQTGNKATKHWIKKRRPSHYEIG